MHSCICLFQDPMDCSPPGSSVDGIFQARILKWCVISFSMRYSWSSDGTHVSCVSCIGRWILYHCTTHRKGFPAGAAVKHLLASVGDAGSIPGSGRVPWSKKWQLTPVLLPENSMDRGASWAPWGSQRVWHDWTYSTPIKDKRGYQFKESFGSVELESSKFSK